MVTGGGSFGTSPMRLAEAGAIAGLDGVAAVDPQIEFLRDPGPAVGFGAPDLVTGLVSGAAGHETFELEHFVRYHNEVRPHLGIGGRTPHQRLSEKLAA